MRNAVKQESHVLAQSHSAMHCLAGVKLERTTTPAPSLGRRSTSLGNGPLKEETLLPALGEQRNVERI